MIDIRNDEKKLVIDFKDGGTRMVENVIDFDFGDRTFLRVSIKDHSYYMFVAYDCIKCLEVIE